MNAKDKKIQVLASAGLLGTAVIWGLGFVVVKNSLDFIPPSYMLAFRFTIAAVVLAAIFGKRLQSLNRQILKEGALLGFLLFISYLIQTIGCQYTTAGKNAFLTTFYVILVPFLHWLLNRKKPDKYSVLAAFAAIGGIGLLSLDGDLTMNLGDSLTLLCGLGYALHIIYIDRYAQNRDPVLLTILQLGFAAVFSWMVSPVLDGGFPAGAFNKEIIIGMIYLGVFCTMLAFLLQNIGQKYTSPNTASLLLSTESVFGALFSIWFLGERMTGRMAAGCLLLLAAVITAETKLSFISLPGLRQRNAEE